MSSDRTVLVYRNELLPISETFIKEQVLSLRKWRAVLIGLKAVNQLPLDDLTVRVLGADNPGLLSRLAWKTFQLTGTIPPRIKRILDAEGASLVHAHFGIDALDAWPLARALNVPMLVTLHGYDINIYREWWEAGEAGFRARFYPRLLLGLAKKPQVRFLAVSEAIRHRAIEFGIPADKVFVRYIGIDSTKFSPGPTQISKRPPRVLFVGRLVEKKGCQYLVEAMADVQRKIRMAELVVVGDGPLRATLEQLARARGTNVKFRGVLSNQDVKRELDAARVFCLPSITAENGDAEGLPISILEAQASGIPVITSARGGVGEAVKDNETGLVFGERDSPKLAIQLLKILTSDDLADRISNASVAMIASCFSHQLLSPRLEALYDEISGTSAARS
ncbi:MULTISPECIES: glycosyltransferase [Bradyrhizobium]|uniref:glycosyltransferase n=1 Tax=Bradyrhizobium TaxID=374 RepID=UPI00293E18BB|nr:glycosyltransferase [Bradyrhizobium sp. BWC-3-1]WOH57322.1 glycosyltransferase [Bradyrhizobium sp. BWC-3-1]